MAIKGKFPYKDGDKKSKKEKARLRAKEQEKLLKKQDKELKMQCECNHLDSKKNKTHFKYNEDHSIATCKICGGQMLTNPDALDEDSVKMAKMIVYTIFGQVRNKLNISEDVDKQISKTLLTVSRMDDLLALIKDQYSDGDKKKKDKKKNKDKKKSKGGSYRINY